MNKALHTIVLSLLGLTVTTSHAFDGIVDLQDFLHGQPVKQIAAKVTRPIIQMPRFSLPSIEAVKNAAWTGASSAAKALYSKWGAGVGVGVSLAAYYWFVERHRVAIKAIKDEFKQQNSMVLRPAQAAQPVNQPVLNNRAIIEIYNWRNPECLDAAARTQAENAGNYPTPGSVGRAERQCITHLIADAMNGQLVGFNPDVYGVANNGDLHRQAAIDILAMIDREINRLDDARTRLKPHIYCAGYHLKFWTNHNSFVIDYAKELESICRTQSANVNNPATWTIAQYDAIDAHMKQRAGDKYIKFLRGYTAYAQAARLDWDLFKKWARLIAIRQAFVKDTRVLHVLPIPPQLGHVGLHIFNHQQ